MRIARDLLDHYSLAVASLAGGYGATAEEFDAACRLAVALDTSLLGGSAPYFRTDRAGATAALSRHGLRLAIENHPGLLTAEEILAVVEDGADGLIGTTVDTGWYGTAQIDAVQAIRELGRNIFHVHLKDVEAPGGHSTCQYGRGCVPIEACVYALRDQGYAGGISVEHEPEDRDPREECRAGAALLRTWLGA
jgi:sugar phosphate isomerase/epimerase